MATKNSDNWDNSKSAKATASNDDFHLVMEGVEGVDENSSSSCRNCRNDSEEVPSNASPEPVLADKDLSEKQSEDVGNSDNGDDPDKDPPGGNGGSPVTPMYNSPSGESGGELLIKEMAAWHSRLNACQTLDDAMNFHAALQNMSQEQRDSFESTIPESKWDRFVEFTRSY